MIMINLIFFFKKVELIFRKRKNEEVKTINKNKSFTIKKKEKRKN